MQFSTYKEGNVIKCRKKNSKLMITYPQHSVGMNRVMDKAYYI